MKIVVPYTIDDTALVSNSVSETDTLYSAGTNYKTGDIVRRDTTHRRYESQIGTSSTVTMTIASPCVVTWTAHGLAAGTPIVFSTTGALPTGLTAGTTYYVLAPTTNSFNVAATSGGSAINTSGSQSGTHTAIANPNVGLTPEDNSDEWLDIGPTNPWAMFDSTIGTQTSDADEIEAVVQVAGRANSVALLNIAGNSVTIVASTAASGEIYNQTYDLTNTAGINTWYSYLFEPVTRTSDFIATDLPIDYSPEITVTLDAPSGTARIGSLIIGLSKTLGLSLYGASVGIRDFSRKEADDFGNYSVVERAFSKKGSFRVWCDNAQLDPVSALLADLRATPTVWIVTDETGMPFSNATTIFGFVSDWRTEINYRENSLCTLEIEGLT